MISNSYSMETFTIFRYILPLTVLLTIVVIPLAEGQSSNMLCTGTMMRSFNPCISFLTGGANTSSSPTTGCCNSLKDLMSNGQDCLCLIVTGGVPFQVPINRSLAISLPRACKMSGVPVECKGTASPVPAPDPGSPVPDQPNLPPGLSPPSPTGNPFLPRPLTPPSLTPPGGDVIPTLTPPGMRPTLTPSAATATAASVYSSSFLAALGIILMRLYWYVF